MAKLLLHHHNDCPRCPIVGAEDIPSEEYYELLSLRFSLRIAQELSKTHDLIRVEPAALERWLEHARIDEHPIDRSPPNPGHGIMVTLPPRLRNATDRRQPPRRPRPARQQ